MGTKSLYTCFSRDPVTYSSADGWGDEAQRGVEVDPLDTPGSVGRGMEMYTFLAVATATASHLASSETDYIVYHTIYFYGMS